MKLIGLTKAKVIGSIVSDYLLSTIHRISQGLAALLMISERILCVLACGELPRRRVPVLLYRRETVDPTYDERMPPQS